MCRHVCSPMCRLYNSYEILRRFNATEAGQNISKKSMFPHKFVLKYPKHVFWLISQILVFCSIPPDAVVGGRGGGGEISPPPPPPSGYAKIKGGLF